MSPLPPWLQHCLQDRIMFASRYAYSQISWSRSKLQKLSCWQTYLKTKTAVAHAAKCWTQCHIFHAFNLVIRSFTSSSNQYFEAPTALSLSLLLSFYRTTWNLSIRSKATWAQSFLMLLAYRKQIIQNQPKTARRVVTINVCWRKSSCELFPVATTHTKVANSGSGKMVIARYASVIFFKKRAALSLTLLEN